MGLWRYIFPKVLLRWQEPHDFKRAQDMAEMRGISRLTLIILGTALGFIWFANMMVPGIALKLLIAFGMVLLGIIFIILMYRFFPSYVEISEAYITRGVSDETNTSWKFKDIDHCEISSVNIKGQEIPVLTIETKRRKRTTMGIAASVSLTELEELLKSKNLKVVVNN